MNTKRAIDFLPAAYRERLAIQRAVRTRVLFALITVLGITLTELAFRWRGFGLERVAELAEEHAADIAMRASCAADYEDQHTLFAAELEEWTKPLEIPTATAMLRALLLATPESIALDRLDWSHAFHAENPAPPRCDLQGAAADAHALAAWLRALEKCTALPAVELASSQRGAASRSGELCFRVQSKEPPR